MFHSCIAHTFTFGVQVHYGGRRLLCLWLPLLQLVWKRMTSMGAMQLADGHSFWNNSFCPSPLMRPTDQWSLSGVEQKQSTFSSLWAPIGVWRLSSCHSQHAAYLVAHLWMIVTATFCSHGRYVIIKLRAFVGTIVWCGLPRAQPVRGYLKLWNRFKVQSSYRLLAQLLCQALAVPSLIDVIVCHGIERCFYLSVKRSQTYLV